MSAGSFEAGLGLAGEDPLPNPSPPRNVTPPDALWFDGATADYLLDESNGLYKSLHPVDQKVALALIVRQGTIGGAPEMGNLLRSIKKIGPTTTATVSTYVNAALADMVANADITVTKVDVETRNQGAILVAVTYKNLRLHAPRAQTIRVNL